MIRNFKAVMAHGHKQVAVVNATDLSNEAKRGVEFCHSTRNVSRTRRKISNGSVITLGP